MKGTEVKVAGEGKAGFSIKGKFHQPFGFPPGVLSRTLLYLGPPSARVSLEITRPGMVVGLLSVDL